MNKRMKTLGRLLAAVTSLAILLSMTAFAEEKSGGATPTPAPTEEPTAEPDPTPATPTAAAPYLTA